MKFSTFYQFLLLALVTLGVYYPTLFAPYNSLDDQIFVNHLLNQQGFSWARHFSPGGTYDYYRPLLSLTFEVDKYVGGLQETFMHLVNVLVHLLNVILVWLLARRFGEFIQRPSEWLPLLAALLFALHPINTEAVNWIAGRTDLLAGTFVFFSLYALLKFIERRSLLWGVVGALALLGGALCKETALFLVPGACFLLLCHPEQNRPTWPLRWVLPALYGLAVSAYFCLRWGAFNTDRGLVHTAKLAAQTVGIVAPAADGLQAVASVPFPWLDAVRVALKVSGFYALKLFQPLPLNFAIYQLDALYIIPGIALSIALVVLACRRQLVGWLFLVSASIAISALFVAFTKLAWTPVAERYMYIPCGPFVIGLAYAVGTRIKPLAWQRASIVVVSLLLGVGAWTTATRNIVWQDNLTLYQDTVRQSPDFAPARNQLALALKAHNRHDEANDILINNKVSAGGIPPLNVAAALWDQGDYAAARGYLMKLLVDKPGAQETLILEMLIKITTEHLNGIDDDSLKRNGYKDVRAWLGRILEISSTAFNYYRIGRIHLLLDDKLAAQRAFAEAAKRFPSDSIYKAPATKLARDLAQ
jgi:tetratricopeptide (TPR) repeat protein